MTTKGDAYGLGEVSGWGTLSKVGGSAGVAEGAAGGGVGIGVEAGVGIGVAEAWGVGVGFAFGETEGTIFRLRGIWTVGAADGFLAFDSLLTGIGIKRTDIGFGYSESYAPVLASTAMPTTPPAITFPAITVPPVAPPLLSTFTVCETYPGLLIVTVKLSVRRCFTNFAGVTLCSPVESRTSAAGGSLSTVSFSWMPRVIVAQEVKKRSGRRRQH